jgi:hypothetical protein
MMVVFANLVQLFRVRSHLLARLQATVKHLFPQLISDQNEKLLPLRVGLFVRSQTSERIQINSNFTRFTIALTYLCFALPIAFMCGIVHSQPRVVLVADPMFFTSAEKIRDKLLVEGVLADADVIVLRVDEPFLANSAPAMQLKYIDPQVIIASQPSIFRMMSTLSLRSKGILFSHGPWASGGDDESLESIPMLGVRVTSFLDADIACLDWLVSIAPSIRRVGIIADVRSSVAHMKRVETRAKSRQLDVVGFSVANVQEAARLIESSAQREIDAWYLPHTPVVWRGPGPVLDAARRSRVPVAFEYSHIYAKSGGLIACASQYDTLQRIADAVSYLLVENPRSAPIDFRPNTLSVSINIDTAKFLRLKLTPRLLRRFDHRFSAKDAAISDAVPLVGDSR